MLYFIGFLSFLLLNDLLVFPESLKGGSQFLSFSQAYKMHARMVGVRVLRTLFK